MPDGEVRVKGKVDEYVITGPFQFYGTSAEMLAVAHQLTERAKGVGHIGEGWASCDPAATGITTTTIKKVK